SLAPPTSCANRAPPSPPWRAKSATAAPSPSAPPSSGSGASARSSTERPHGPRCWSVRRGMENRPMRRGRSRSGGVPVVLDDRPDAPETLFGDVAPPEPRQEVLPGAVLVPGWLDDEAQRDLVAAFREWARPPAGLRHPRMPTGHL